MRFQSTEQVIVPPTTSDSNTSATTLNTNALPALPVTPPPPSMTNSFNRDDAPPPPKKKKCIKQPTNFSFIRHDNEYTAIPIPVHKSESAFKSYIKKKDYPSEIVNAMGKTTQQPDISDESAGATRLLKEMAKNYKKEFMEVVQAKGFKFDVGKLDAFSLAACQEDTGIKDWQMLVSLKHLRHGLKGTVSVPFLHTKKFSEGHVTTKTKKFDHQYDSNGEIVSVECMYQSVQEMTCVVVASKLTELKLK